MKGLLITVEGPDGAGKSTQIRQLANILGALGSRVVTTREPGGTLLGTAIRKILLGSEHGSMVEKAEVLLYAADRAQHVAEIILPALQRGEVVLCDRFIDSTVAYQGYGRGIGLEFLEQINTIAAGGLKPDLTLIFDVPVEVGLARIIAGRDGTAGTDRMESLDLEFHRRVRTGYLEIAAREPGRCRVIDAGGSVEQVGAAAAREVKDFLSGLPDRVWGKTNEN